MALITLLLGGMLFGLSGLILALPLTATIKVIFDAIPSMEAFGFLIGEPEKQHLKRNATQELLTKWGIVKKPKIKSKIQVDINVETDTKATDTTISYKEINESEDIPYTDATSNKKEQKPIDK